MELSLYGLDIILGMDWLSEHKANIKFKLKRVTLQSNEDKKVVVDGEQS